MTTKRRSLKDRNSAAIAFDPEPETAAPPVNPEPEPAPAPPAPVETPRAPRPAASTATAGTATARIGIYLTPGEFTNAKAAYLADWTNGGDADTFARWVTAALEAHAQRTPKQRAARSHLKERSSERTGGTRSFNIPADTVDRMRSAIAADQHAGRWPSDSAWCSEALALAVDAARTANGGVLPTPPQRLPNRLAR